MIATAAYRLRWSSARDCVRKAQYEHEGAPARERTDREERILFRGRSVGEDYVRWLRRQHGDDNVLAEVPIRWQYGVGHMDAFVVPQALAVEVLSSANGRSQVDTKMLQLCLYMEHFPAAAKGAVVVVDPADFSEDVYELARGSRTYRLLAEDVAERVDLIRRWTETGEHAPRVCRKPTDAAGHFCRFAEHCFAGWEAAPVAVIDDKRALDLVAALADTKRIEKHAKDHVASVEAERKQLEAALAELVEAGETAVGSWLVRRTDVQRSATLDVKKAEAAGLLNTDLLAEFMRPGAAYTTWKVTRHTDDGEESQ